MHAVFGSLLVLMLSVAGTREANALTMMLDFSSTATDVFGETTGSFDSAAFSFSGLDQTQAEQAVLTAVTDHYLGYVSSDLDSSSPLASGFELDIDFEIGLVGSTPGNGDSEYYFVKIGTGLSGTNATNTGVLGAACYGCIRGGTLLAPVGALVGSIFSDHIAGLISFASNDTELINLLAGTVSHEIGHTLLLAHAGAKAANPGESLWGVMGSGATSMPIGQRVLEREFTYTNFGTLIDQVGLREAPLQGPALVPAPASLSLLVVVLVFFRRRFLVDLPGVASVVRRA